MSIRTITLVLAAMVAAGAVAASAFGAKGPSYSPSLNVAWPSGAASTTDKSGVFYTVNGCGYNSSLGGVNVTVTSPYAVSSAGQMPDANGCISVSNFDTLGAGHYTVSAYQSMKGKMTLVAQTSFDN
jgi:hypothetical protein